MSTPLSVRKALLMIYFIYIAYISFQNDKKVAIVVFKLLKCKCLIILLIQFIH